MNSLIKNIRIGLIILAVTLFGQLVNGQVTVQIGSGNDAPVSGTQYSPLFRFSAASATTNSRSNILFTQAELTAAGIPAGSTILSIQFNKLNANNFLVPSNFNMLMKNSSNRLLDPVVVTWTDIQNSFTPVYSNASFNIPATTGWVAWNLQTPFIYNGGGLEIATENTMTGGNTGATGNIAWEWTAGTPSSSIIGSTNFGNLSSGQPQYRARPNIKISYYPPQVSVQIGTGAAVPPNGTQYSPVFRFSAASATTNSRSDILFTQSELAAAGIPAGATITSLQFNKLNINNFLIPTNFSMLMKNSSNTLLDPAVVTWMDIQNSFTSVYSNASFNIPATTGWVTWNLQTPFLYNGNALEIATENTMTGGATGATGNIAWEYTASTPVSMVVGSTNLNPLSSAQPQYRLRPNIKINYYPPACAAPSNPVVTNITNTNASINWNGVSGAIGYQYAITNSSIPPQSGTDITTTSVNATGLNPLTQYYIHVRTNCGSGYSLFWATTPFNTLEACPKPSVPTVLPNNFDGTALISWNPSPFGASNYEYAITNNATPPASGTAVNNTSVQATGLTGATKYYVHVRANCSAQGFSSWVTKEFTMPCYTPVLSVSADLRSSGADFKWNNTAGSHKYEYAITSSASKPASGASTTDTVYKAERLHDGATYHFHVRSYCGTAVSEWATVSFNTSGIELFPNPATENLQIRLHSTNAANGQVIAVVDATGKTVLKRRLTGNTITIQTAAWKPGIYFVRYIDGNNKYVKRMIKL